MGSKPGWHYITTSCTSKKVEREIVERLQKENRSFTLYYIYYQSQDTYYQSQVVLPFVLYAAGNYDQGLLYQPPSTSEIPPETFFKYKKSSARAGLNKKEVHSTIPKFHCKCFILIDCK